MAGPMCHHSEWVPCVKGPSSIGVGQPGVPVGLITRRSKVQILPPLLNVSHFTMAHFAYFSLFWPFFANYIKMLPPTQTWHRIPAGLTAGGAAYFNLGCTTPLKTTLTAC